QPEVIRWVVELLCERRRFSEADQALRTLEEQGPLGKDLARSAADLALRNRDYPRAVALARQAVAPDTRDYRDHLWLAHLLQTAGRPAEAEATLRRAARIAPAVPDVWVSLVRHLARTGQAAEAAAVIRQARQKLPADRAPLALARCYEALGQIDRAEALY